jgi:hypothetical protein
MRSSTFLSSILLIVFLFSNSLAQQAKPHPNQTGWLLEVTYLKGAPPAYERVRLPGSKTPGDWFGRFGQVAGWQLPAGAQPVSAVRISNRLKKDETIRIRVSVMRGLKFMDVEETVATFDLLENEKVTVKALENFGVEPFQIKAIRSAPLPANLPASINKTTSVEVLGIEPVASDMPEFKLTLHNLSMKTIEALRVEIVDGQKRLSSGMPQGLEGKPLMLGGETTQVRIPLVVNAGGTKGTYVPSVPLPQQIVIRAVIFADGTDEGVTERDWETGAAFQGVKFGRRIELQRALPLFAAALESTDAISSDGPSNFRAQLEQLNLEVTDAELVDLQNRFPAREGKLLKSPVEFGIHLMRKEMLDQITRFENAAKEKDFRTWLVDAGERYSRWLARLEIPDPAQP